MVIFIIPIGIILLIGSIIKFKTKKIIEKIMDNEINKYFEEEDFVLTSNEVVNNEQNQEPTLIKSKKQII